ncbi:MAG: hypothetical protein ACKVXR_08580 [Planctomycetota bacterium]
MKLRSAAFTALMTLGAAACESKTHATLPSPAARSATGFDWPVSEGWKHETIPFPLAFAPGLPFRGVEELRFAPGFFERDASTFWSYAFVWWLEDPPSFDAPAISAVLREYFAGLSLAVGKDKYAMDPERFRAELAPRNEGGRTILEGRVYSYDAFVTGEPIVLNVEARLRACPQAGRRAITFLLSPKPLGDAVWDDLRGCEASLHCE